MELPGYQLGPVLFEGAASSVHRATSTDGSRVVVKMPAHSHPPPRVIARYQRAFDVARRADESAVVRHIELIRVGSSLALVMEDFGASSLRDAVVGTGMRIHGLLDVAWRLAVALGQLHASGVVHRDIKPDNVVFREDGEIRLIDLGIARELDAAEPAERGQNRLEGTLAYMSPEQFGRVRATVDDRSDLYAMGVTLFELATGQLPFQQQTPAALAHAHVAQAPPRVTSVRPDLPEVFAAIVDRLLQKDVDDRYATAFGLAKDLQRCKRDLEQTGQVHPFALGEADPVSRFRIPDRL